MASEIFLSIFTPTFNRAHTLGQLYASLCRQTSDQFIWLIVDDGSTDDTESLVKTWMTEGKIRIVYHKQANGGKQRAFNTGVQLCATDCFFCVDSDDYLTDNAVESICHAWMSICDNMSLSGIIALKGHDIHTPMSTPFPAGIQFSPLSELYVKHKFSGETALVYRTSILRKFPYEVAEGEKFIAENYVYMQIDQSFSMLLLDKIINICGYLEDGYTKHIFRVIYNSPRSYMKLKILSMDLAPSIRIRFIHAIALLSAYFILRKKERNFPWNLYTIAAYLPGYLIYLHRFRKYARQS